MKIIVIFAILVATALYFGFEKSEQEKALSEMVDCLDEMADILDTVKDNDTAASAMPKLDKLGRKMQAASVEMTNSFSKGDPQEMQSLIVKYQKPLDEAGQRFMKELMRVNCISGVGKDFQQFFAFMNSGSRGSSGRT